MPNLCLRSISVRFDSDLQLKLLFVKIKYAVQKPYSDLGYKRFT